MKKKLIYLTLILFFLFPNHIFAISKKYEDKVAPITNTEIEENKINLYLFKGAECPHCAEEKEWLETIKEDYKEYLNIYEFEVWHNEENAKLYESVKEIMKSKTTGVPFTVVGKYYYVGFSETTASNSE